MTIGLVTEDPVENCATVGFGVAAVAVVVTVVGARGCVGVDGEDLSRS